MFALLETRRRKMGVDKTRTWIGGLGLKLKLNGRLPGA